MTTRRKWLLVSVFVCLLLGAALFLSSPKRGMRKYVMARKSQLDSYAMQCLSESIPYQGTFDGRGAEIPRPDILLIHWGAFGLTPSGQYYELLYSADGAPHPYPGMEDYDEYDQMFNWRWVQPDGDNGCIVENIDGNWYYCKAWF